ncbi:MAG TPA: hypothetical protein VH186_31225 [Chloroflexia bacterium]|nr:hypothetical protein [Chloroflexia bacterium]
MRRPQSNTFIAWLGAATEDLADTVERLNNDLDNRDNDPDWGRKVWKDSVDIVSLRRWSFLLPGGGALRAGRPPQGIKVPVKEQEAEVAPVIVEKVANP